MSKTLFKLNQIEQDICLVISIYILYTAEQSSYREAFSRGQAVFARDAAAAVWL